MGTSSSHEGGSGGAWTEFKRAASSFARAGGRSRAAGAMAGHVAALGGAQRAAGSAGAGIRTGHSLGRFLAASMGANGLADGLAAVGLADLVGRERFEVLTALLDRFAGAGSDLEAQAARSALLDVLDEVLPADGVPLDSVRLDTAAVIDTLQRYLAALVYNRAIPVIDERLTRLEDPQLAQRRDRELRDYITALVRLHTIRIDPLALNWNGPDGRAIIEALLGRVWSDDHPSSQISSEAITTMAR